MAFVLGHNLETQPAQLHSEHRLCVADRTCPQSSNAPLWRWGLRVKLLVWGRFVLPPECLAEERFCSPWTPDREQKPGQFHSGLRTVFTVRYFTLFYLKMQWCCVTWISIEEGGKKTSPPNYIFSSVCSLLPKSSSGHTGKKNNTKETKKWGRDQRTKPLRIHNHFGITKHFISDPPSHKWKSNSDCDAASRASHRSASAQRLRTASSFAWQYP